MTTMFDSLALLDQDMATCHLEGFWRLGREMTLHAPYTRVQAHLWKWHDVYNSLVRAGELVTLDNSERRTVRLINPGLPHRHCTTNTLQLSFQYIKPGEFARAHRHSIAAVRFIIQGCGAYTTVDGQQCVMEEGDFIVTPQMAWHDHANPTDQPIIWLDALDAPLIQMLEQVIFENYELSTQPITCTSDQISLLFGSVRPIELNAAYYHYRWRDVYPILQTMVQYDHGVHRFDGYVLEYRNPVDGGPTLPTMQCALHLFKPGQETDCHRHTSTTIYHVFRGSGSTVIENMRFDWETGDSFVVPLWHAHYHLNRSSTDEAILFSLSDSPVLRALNLYREIPCTT